MQNLSTERFSDRVENYLKYRPGYPKEIIPLLENEIGLSSSHVLADVGSGTGKSSELFLLNGNPVFGVEPNTEMRQAAEELLKSYSTFTSIPGTAENTLLADQSIDFIVAGQAFHWFKYEAAKVEFKRILKPGGGVVLIWNERDNRSPFLKAYDDFLLENAIDYQEVDHRNVDANVLRQFYDPQGYELYTMPNYQTFDFEGLTGRYLSCSYAYPESHPLFPVAVENLWRVFEHYQQHGKVKMAYNTRVYFGKLS